MGFCGGGGDDEFLLLVSGCVFVCVWVFTIATCMIAMSAFGCVVG
jgi:hypothetical protein